MATRSLVPGFPAHKLRGWFWQGLLLAALALFVWVLASNTAHNLTRLNIPFGWSFLSRPAGFDIPFKLVDWQTTDTYGRAIFVCLLNTLLVSFLAVVSATFLGLAFGIMRLSSNWLVRATATGVTEVVKNTPQLVQIFFLYVAVLQTLPQLRQSIKITDSILLNVRGLFLPTPILGPAANATIWGTLIAIGVAILLSRQSRGLPDRRASRVRALAWLLPVAVFAAGWAAGAVTGWEVPRLERFNIRGGWTLKPELLAIWLGLTTYAAAFIADIVRSAILGVARGQTEAAESLGLTRGQTLRLVVLPQALRQIVPPLTSQYLNIIKSSSLGAAIAYPELFLMIGRTMLNQTGQAVEAMSIIMGIFLTINLITSAFMNWYNRRIALTER